MQSLPQTTTINPPSLSPSPRLTDPAAAERAFVATAEANGVTAEMWEGMAAMRHAADFLYLASEAIAKGAPIDAPETMDWFRWAVMKIVEFNGMLPEELRGDLSYGCFQRR